MPLYRRHPFFEKIGKKELISQLTQKSWHSWWIWCRSNNVDAYSAEALKLWIKKNIWKIVLPPDNETGQPKSSKKKSPKFRSDSSPVNTTNSPLPPPSEIDTADS